MRSPFALRNLWFADPAQERRYQHARTEWLAPRFLRIVVLIACVFIAFIPFDLVFAAEHAMRLAVARLVIAGALLAVGCLAHCWPARRAMSLAPPVVAALVYCGVFWTRFIVGLDSEYEFTEAVMLIQIGVWFLGGMMFVTAAAVNLAGAIAFAAVELAVGVPARHVWLSGLYLCALLAVGGFAAWQIERLFRRNFADQEESDMQRREYRTRAMRDGLTGLWNRQAMQELLAASCRLSTVAGVGGAVLMIDLDRFKPVNDRFGHQAGDDVLVSVARRIQAELRAGDSAGRVGGDEFIVVAGNMPDESAAREFGARIRRGIETPMRVRLHDESVTVEVAVGASIGVALFGGDAVAPETIIHAADQDMYREKSRRKEGADEPR